MMLLDLFCRMECISRKWFSCPHCDKCYNRRSGLQQHIRTIHDGQPNKYKCIYCERTFSDSSNRNRHQRVVHVGQRNYSCEHCGEDFAFKWLLGGHQHEHHNIGKKRRCSCGKELNFNSNYYTHQRICKKLNLAPQTIPCGICRRKYKSPQKAHKV